MGRNAMLGFSGPDGGDLCRAGSAGVFRHCSGSGSGEDFGTFGLTVYFGGADVGTLGTGHFGEGFGRGCVSLAVVEHLTDFGRGCDAVLASAFVLGVTSGSKGKGEGTRACNQERFAIRCFHIRFFLFCFWFRVGFWPTLIKLRPREKHAKIKA
jgi:hypothetical protein